MELKQFLRNSSEKSTKYKKTHLIVGFFMEKTCFSHLFVVILRKQINR
jgi:hypothetical protein